MIIFEFVLWYIALSELLRFPDGPHELIEREIVNRDLRIIDVIVDGKLVIRGVSKGPLVQSFRRGFEPRGSQTYPGFQRDMKTSPMYILPQNYLISSYEIDRV